jgi:hypothetical protein
MTKFEDRYPEGKMNDTDEGVLNIQMGFNKDGKFIIDFGKPVVWIGMTKEQAFQFGKRIMMQTVDTYVKLEVPDEESPDGNHT